MDGGAWWAAIHGVAGVGHDWATSLSLFTFMHWRGKWQPTPVFLPGKSQGQEAWWAAVYGVTQSWTRLKWHSSSSSYIGHSFSSKEQVSFNFMVALTIFSDFGAPKKKVSHCYHCCPVYFPWSDETRCHDFSFLNVLFLASFFTLLFHFHEEA